MENFIPIYGTHILGLFLAIATILVPRKAGKQRKLKDSIIPGGRQFIEKPQKKQITSEKRNKLRSYYLKEFLISLRGITCSLGISMTWLQKLINNLYRSVPLELKVRDELDLEIKVECDE